MYITEKIELYLNESVIDELKKYLNMKEWKNSIIHNYQFREVEDGFIISIEGFDCIFYDGNSLSYTKLEGKSKKNIPISSSQAEIYALCSSKLKKENVKIIPWK